MLSITLSLYLIEFFFLIFTESISIMLFNGFNGFQYCYLMLFNGLIYGFVA